MSVWYVDAPEFMLQCFSGTSSQLVNHEPPIATSHTPSALKSSQLAIDQE